MLTKVQPTELDTPWPPQEIVWRGKNEYTRGLAYRAQINAGYSHIVREVLIRGPRTHDKLTITQAEDTIAHTEDEFDILRTLGISIADTKWHVFVDEESEARALARVQVIIGETIPVVYDNKVGALPEPQRSIQQLFKGATRAYKKSTEPGERLCDVDHPRQYLFGRPRKLPQGIGRSASLTLIDIDPIYWFTLWD